MKSIDIEFDGELSLDLEREKAVIVSSRSGELVVTIQDRRFLRPLLHLARLKMKSLRLIMPPRGFFQTIRFRATYYLGQTAIARWSPDLAPSLILQLMGLKDLPLRIYFGGLCKALLFNR